MQFAKPRHSAGFTLVEVMIGLALLGLMLTILFSGLRLGARSWDTAERKLVAVAERELAVRLVERQFALSMPVSYERGGVPAGLAFHGEPDRVTWVSPLPAHRGGGGLQLMTLALGATDRGAGLVLAYRLFRPEAGDGAQDEGEEVLLLDGIGDMRLTYFGVANEDSKEPAWSPTWDHDARLPALVRIELFPEAAGARPLAMVVAPRQDQAARGVDFGPFGP